MAHRQCLFGWEFGLGAEVRHSADDLQRIRDAETAHLDAVLKIDGAKYLRLARMREELLPLVPDGGMLDLRSFPGDEPQLWLDISHRVTMQPDPKTYRISQYGADAVSVLLETEARDAALAFAGNVLRHRELLNVRRSTLALQRFDGTPFWSKATLVYVWMTGIVTGIAASALVGLMLK